MEPHHKIEKTTCGTLNFYHTHSYQTCKRNKRIIIMQIYCTIITIIKEKQKNNRIRSLVVESKHFLTPQHNCYLCMLRFVEP